MKKTHEEAIAKYEEKLHNLKSESQKELQEKLTTLASEKEELLSKYERIKKL